MEEALMRLTEWGLHSEPVKRIADHFKRNMTPAISKGVMKEGKTAERLWNYVMSKAYEALKTHGFLHDETVYAYAIEYLEMDGIYTGKMPTVPVSANKPAIPPQVGTSPAKQPPKPTQAQPKGKQPTPKRTGAIAKPTPPNPKPSPAKTPPTPHSPKPKPTTQLTFDML